MDWAGGGLVGWVWLVLGLAMGTGQCCLKRRIPDSVAKEEKAAAKAVAGRGGKAGAWAEASVSAKAAKEAVSASDASTQEEQAASESGRRGLRFQRRGSVRWVPRDQQTPWPTMMRRMEPGSGMGSRRHVMETLQTKGGWVLDYSAPHLDPAKDPAAWRPIAPSPTDPDTNPPTHSLSLNAPLSVPTPPPATHPPCPNDTNNAGDASLSRNTADG